jgi:hypothetical protein
MIGLLSGIFTKYGFTTKNVLSKPKRSQYPYTITTTTQITHYNKPKNRDAARRWRK